jgi:hypothetical protein
LRIERYFEQIQAAVEACPVLQTFSLTYDKRGTYEGFIRGELNFVDGSMLHLREFVDVASSVDRLTYVYQYMTATQHLVFVTITPDITVDSIFQRIHTTNIWDAKTA